MEQYYINRELYKGPISGTDLVKIGMVSGLPMYRLAKIDENRTSAFSDDIGVVGGLASLDMQKFRDMSEEMQQIVKSRLRTVCKITTLIELGDEIEPGLFRFAFRDESKIEDSDPFDGADLDHVLTESSNAFPKELNYGVAYKLGGD